MLDRIKTLLERGVGFEMREIMSGIHWFENGAGPVGEFPISFNVVWGTDNILEWINPKSPRFLINDLRGSINVGGLCEKADVRGVLELRYFKDFKIRYQFDFEANGRIYTYVGEKVNIKPWNLPVSHTTCFGTIVEKDTNRLISRSVVFFRYSTIPQFLFSFRFKL